MRKILAVLVIASLLLGGCDWRQRLPGPCSAEVRAFCR